MRKRIANFQTSQRRLLLILLISLFISIEFYYAEGARGSRRFGDRRSNNGVRAKEKCGNNGIKRMTMLFNLRAENFIEMKHQKTVVTGSAQVNGTLFNVLEIESCGTNETRIHGPRSLGTRKYKNFSMNGTRVRMRFVWSGSRYLCFNGRGRVTTRNNGDLKLCQFYEIPVAEQIYIAKNDTRFDGTFVYHSVFNRKWALGFKKNRKPWKGRAAFRRSQDYFYAIDRNERISKYTSERFKVAQFSKRRVPDHMLDSLDRLKRSYRSYR